MYMSFLLKVGNQQLATVYPREGALLASLPCSPSVKPSFQFSFHFWITELSTKLSHHSCRPYRPYTSLTHDFTQPIVIMSGIKLAIYTMNAVFVIIWFHMSCEQPATTVYPMKGWYLS